MSKKKKRRCRQPNDVMRIDLPEINDDYMLVPNIVLSADISEYALHFALLLCDFSQDSRGNVDASCKYPSKALMARAMDTTVDVIDLCEQELISAHLLTIHPDGTFSLDGMF